MLYSMLLIGIIILHYIIKIALFESVTDYLLQTRALLKSKRYTDGCSTPFKTYVHRWFSHSHDLCAAHDYGNLGYLSGIRPGWHNNLVTWFAHMSQGAPIYWVWGTLIAVFTLPWSAWRRNFGITFLGAGPFHGVLFLIIAVVGVVYYSAK